MCGVKLLSFHRVVIFAGARLGTRSLRESRYNKRHAAFHAAFIFRLVHTGVHRERVLRPDYAQGILADASGEIYVSARLCPILRVCSIAADCSVRFNRLFADKIIGNNGK